MSNPNVTVDRHKYIGGSDLPNILGFNEKKYNKPLFDFAKEKAGIIENTFKGNEYTRYGQLLEPIIRDYINANNGYNFIEDTIIDEARKLRGNTDGIDRDNAILLEVKTFGNELDVEYYTPQCRFYMETFNIDKCILVGYPRPDNFYTGMSYELENDDVYFNLDFNPDNLVVYEITRDNGEWLKIYDAIERFRKVVEELKANPDMTEEEFKNSFYNYSKDLIKYVNKLTVLENKLIEMKKVEAQIDEFRAKLYEEMDKHNIKSFKNNLVSITKVEPSITTRVTVDTKQLQADLPNIYNKYTKTSVTNKKGYLLIKINEEDK